MWWGIAVNLSVGKKQTKYFYMHLYKSVEVLQNETELLDLIE